MEDLKFIICFILALITFVIHIVGRRLLKKYHKERKEKEKDAVGRIERINDNESGNSWFYIVFEKDGKTHIAQTSSYIKKPKDIKIGDEVKIKYRLTKGKYALCRIMDDGFKSVINYDEYVPSNFMLTISILFLAFGIVGLINYLL